VAVKRGPGSTVRSTSATWFQSAPRRRSPMGPASGLPTQARLCHSRMAVGTAPAGRRVVSRLSQARRLPGCDRPTALVGVTTSTVMPRRSRRHEKPRPVQSASR
jgi:hypothetical protein